MKLLYTKLMLRKIAGGASVADSKEAAAPAPYPGMPYSTKGMQDFARASNANTKASAAPTVAQAVPTQADNNQYAANASARQGGFQAYKQRRDAQRAERNSRIVNGRLQPTQAQKELEARREEAQQDNAAYDAYVNSTDYKVEQRQRQQKAQQARAKAAVASPPKEMTTLPPEEIRKDYVYTATGDGPGKWVYKPKVEPMYGSTTRERDELSDPDHSLEEQDPRMKRFNSILRRVEAGHIRDIQNLADEAESGGWQEGNDYDFVQSLPANLSDRLRSAMLNAKKKYGGTAALNRDEAASTGTQGVAVTKPSVTPDSSGNVILTYEPRTEQQKQHASDAQQHVRELRRIYGNNPVGALFTQQLEPWQRKEIIQGINRYRQVYPGVDENNNVLNPLPEIGQPKQRSWYNPMTWF